MGRRNYRRKYRSNSYNDYKLISGASYLVRFIFCFYTIGTIDLYNNPIINEFIDEFFSLYTLLWALSYFTNKIFFIEKYNIKDSSTRSIIYFFIHLVYSFILYGIMSLLVWLKILPM